jgi:rhodanese-related sulfurtransferase
MTQETKPELPKGKQTVLGLYVTAKEAYEKWQADPDKVKVLDVRTPDEYIYVGHTEMAVNIPLVFQTHSWSEEKGYFDFEPNPEFFARVQEWAQASDVLLVMCRSGVRSAMAVNGLAKAGYTHVFNITDGMEGDAANEPGRPGHGKRTINGWTNSGAPWTYEINPEMMRLPNK